MAQWNTRCSLGACIGGWAAGHQLRQLCRCCQHGCCVAVCVTSQQPAAAQGQQPDQLRQTLLQEMHSRPDVRSLQFEGAVHSAAQQSAGNSCTFMCSD